MPRFYSAQLLTYIIYLCTCSYITTSIVSTRDTDSVASERRVNLRRSLSPAHGVRAGPSSLGSTILGGVDKLPARLTPKEPDLHSSTALAVGVVPITLPEDGNDKIRVFLADHLVKEVTKENYKPHVALWKEFHKDYLGASTDYTMRLVEGGDNEKAKVWMHFCIHLYLCKGLREDQITRVLAGVRYYILVESAGDISFLNLESIKAARQSCHRNTLEQREHAIKSSNNVILPLCLEILVDLHQKYWEDQDWEWEGMLKRATYVCIALGLDIGLRASNLTKAEVKREEHCMMADDLFFVVKPEGRRIPAGSSEAKELDPEQVESMVAHVFTTKTGEVKLAEVPKTIDRGTLESSRLIDCMLELVKRSGVKNGDELFVMYRKGKARNKIYRRVLLRKNISEAIKTCCVERGLPAQHFSSSSMRKTMATNSTLASKPDTETCARAGWTNTRTKNKHYDHSSVLGSLRQTELSLVQVQGMIPAFGDTGGRRVRRRSAKATASNE